nr:MAG TPA: hypothetical protein [Bacteriophage sp.]
MVLRLMVKKTGLILLTIIIIFLEKEIRKIYSI